MNARTRVSLVVLSLVGQVLLSPHQAAAQPSTYYLHNESGSNFATLALKRTVPDTSTVVTQSGDMKGRSPQIGTLGLWTTLVGDPQRLGVIPAGSLVTFTIWMRKTSAFGVVYPFATAQTVETLDVNYQPKQQLCSSIGATALDTTLRAYTFTCSTGSVPVASTDRYAVFAGYSMAQGPGNKSMKVEAYIEGSTDSRAVLPLPASPPFVASLTPASAAVAESVAIAGANFGAVQGNSTVQFNGTSASSSSWSNTSITVAVPSGATSGPVVVTVDGSASNAVQFTVVAPPGITAVNPSSGIVNQTVAISGSDFGTIQGTSSVAFNGVVSSTTTWSETSISAPVPTGATSGPIVVTVNGRASNGVGFTVIPPPTLASVVPASGHVGDTVTLYGNNLAQGPPAVKFNGVAAIVTGATMTAITTSVPTLATSGPIVVTVNGQTSNGIPFTVIESSQPATLTVQTFTYDESAPDGQGPPAGGGAYVSVDGTPVGQTSSDGTLTVEVAPGERVVSATVPSTSSGEASIVLGSGESGSLSIVLDDSKEVTEATDLILVEATDSLIPITSPSFTLRFVRNGTTMPITRIAHVELLDRNGNASTELASLFGIAAGTIAATNAQSFFGWVPRTEPAVLRVQAVDATGFTHSNVIRFSVGQFALELTLAPPPSNPALPVSNIPVSVSVIGTTITLPQTSDAQGRVVIPSLPHATLVVDAETASGGVHYYGRATVSHSGETSATLVLRNVVDLLSSVPPVSAQSVSQNFAGPSGASLSRVQSARQAADRTEERRDTSLVASAASRELTNLHTPALDPEETASISVTSWGTDEPVEQTATLTVPQGTSKVTLKYNVTSLEYPRWVRDQSPFDDVWMLRVFGGSGGQELFGAWRNVNSQLFGDPAWQGNSNTGEIEEEIDVQALAASGDVQLVLYGSSVNIRDYQFNTTVNATLGAQPGLTIKTVAKDTVVPTKGDSTFYSIPRLGDKNVFERWFTLRVTKPENTTIAKVRLTLKDASGGTLQSLLNEAPGPNVRLFEEGTRIEVRASMHSTSSSVQSTPPSTHYLRYEFVVEGSVDGDTRESPPKSSSEMNALWRMPDGFGRFSLREKGLDDWASVGAYDWLLRNTALITRINDISGEHARDLTHSTHYRGVDIDIFHFYTFLASGSGDQNYNALRTNVISALNGSTDAKTRVASWVSASRTGIEALIALIDVKKVYYAIGTAHSESQIDLPNGWAETLLKNATLTVSGKSLDTGAGVWSKATSTKIGYDEIHNTHIHISLDETKLLK
jgi:hypothetical protein